jgi:uncharacterized membrane protein YdbT with pleckstrin-like domain
MGNTKNQDQTNTGPEMIYVTRPAIPAEPHISDEARSRHEDSKRRYPFLNLSEGEYVISAIRRHPIGLLSIWFVVVIYAVFMVLALSFVRVNQSVLGGLVTADGLTGVMAILLLLIVFGASLMTYAYLQNKFFLTNESVIQEIQTSIFARREQTVSLENIEDASFRQQGLLQMVFNYGSIRLSTQGDETTYRFNYVSNPRRQISILNNAVEAFKNGRPVRAN